MLNVEYHEVQGRKIASLGLKKTEFDNLVDLLDFDKNMSDFVKEAEIIPVLMNGREDGWVFEKYKIDVFAMTVYVEGAEKRIIEKYNSQEWGLKNKNG